MAKPIILSFTPFDASKSYTLKFSYSGNQPYSNKLTVYNADTLAVVFTDTETTMKLQHTIPMNSLRNGMKYAATIECFDNEGNASTVSDKYFFKTLATPSFRFSDIKDKDKVSTSSLETNITYYQGNDEDISTYRFYLYNSIKAQLEVSEALYDKSDISYIYKSLENETTYYIRCQGVTESGIPLDTGYIEIFVKYVNPTLYNRLYAYPQDGTGVVNYYTNFAAVEPRDDINYQFDKSFILLHGKDYSLVYDDHFKFSDDYTIAVKFKYYEPGTYLVCKNTDGKELSVSIIKTSDGYRAKLEVIDGISKYILYSSSVPHIKKWAIKTLWVRCINNVYELVLLQSPYEGVVPILPFRMGAAKAIKS